MKNVVDLFCTITEKFPSELYWKSVLSWLGCTCDSSCDSSFSISISQLSLTFYNLLYFLRKASAIFLKFDVHHVTLYVIIIDSALIDHTCSSSTNEYATNLSVMVKNVINCNPIFLYISVQLKLTSAFLGHCASKFFYLLISFCLSL